MLFPGLFQSQGILTPMEEKWYNHVELLEETILD